MSADVCELVLEACDLLERAPRQRAANPVVLTEAACLREELGAAIARCDDEAVAEDGLDAEAALARLLADDLLLSA